MSTVHLGLFGGRGVDVGAEGGGGVFVEEYFTHG